MSVKKNVFCPTICVTHNCNLHCVYCYQEHSVECMTWQTAVNCVDWIFSHIPSECDSVEIDFIGGEPLLEFNLLKKITEYILDTYKDIPFILFATTNGTVLTDDMKAWFTNHKDIFWLGLSLDGTPETHNRNRSSSFDLIDIDFFRRTWPEQGIKMTISEKSISNLAENIKYLHTLGFPEIGGANLAEGDFDWDKDEYLSELIPQLKDLVEFYAENSNYKQCQLLNRDLYICESDKQRRKKWCGTGKEIVFFDCDGKRYPCSYITPMTFTNQELDKILSFDFSNENLFIDESCVNDCYIYPICQTCAGANYKQSGNLGIRNKKKCKINKLVSLFIADLVAKKILNKTYVSSNSTELYYTIEAIKKNRESYLDEYRYLLESSTSNNS